MDHGAEPEFGLEAKLKAAGLRPTQQRAGLARLLFGQGSRHVTAEMLHAEAVSNNMAVSLATVYNTLNRFAEHGLLREVAIEGSKAYFDTTISDHQHFYFEEDGTLIDLPPGEQATVTIPRLPEGMKVARIDVLIRLLPAN